MIPPLTVEHTVGIQAMMQDLNNRADGGGALEEETLALRMLAAPGAQFDYDLNQIKSLNHGLVAPITAGADGNDKFDELVKLMSGSTNTPDQQVANGQAPQPTPVIVVEPGFAVGDVQANIASLKDAHSMLQLYSTMMQVQLKPGGFNITTEAAQSFAFQAQQLYNAMMGPLAGYYTFTAGATQNYDNQIPRDQVHADFLGKVFAGFGFDSATLAALDTKLTTFVGAIKGLNPGASAPTTYDFCQLLGLCPKLNVTGDDSDPVWIYTPTSYLLYMKIDASTFRQSVGKNSSVDKVNFKFQLTVTKCELNVRRFQADKPRFDKIFELVTGKNLQAFSDLLNQQIEKK